MPAALRHSPAAHASFRTISKAGTARGLAVALAAAALATAAAAAEASSRQEPRGGEVLVEGELLVRFRGERRELTYELPPRAGVRAAARSLEENDRVAYAVPNYIARAAGRWIPNDPGSPGEPGGWRQDQWNFLGGPGGVDAPRAWGTLIDRGQPGGARSTGLRGPTVAVLDTGIAYRDEGPFRLSPDFAADQFRQGYDVLDRDHLPLDENGHGTFLAGTIAEQVDNGVAVTGLAYGAHLMPVRVLDAAGLGTAEDIRKGILWAVKHGAKVINLSLEFDPSVDTCEEVKGICEAIRKARAQRAVVIGAAGNGGDDQIGDPAVAYPARAGIAVGATTLRGCLARYSNFGPGLDLVAPGGGRDSGVGGLSCDLVSEENPDIVQLSFKPGGSAGPEEFVLVERHGTSMAAAHVSAVAALTLASRILHVDGHPPSAKALERHLEKTARHVGDPFFYGAGIVNAAEAVRRRSPTGEKTR